MTPIPRTLHSATAIQRALRAFVPFALSVGTAAADSVTVSGSTVQMQASERPGAVAEIILRNILTNGPQDTGQSFDLTHGGLTVSATFTWDIGLTGDDAVTVEPPEGIICVPSDCVLIVREMDTGTLWLFDLQAVGM